MAMPAFALPGFLEPAWFCKDTEAMFCEASGVLNVPLSAKNRTELILLNRRTLLSRMSQTAAAGLCFRRGMLAQSTQSIVLQRGPADPMTLPRDFMGFGYEKSAAAKVGLLRPGNARYVNLIRNFRSMGVLRIGGIVADFSHYQASGQSKATAKDTVITRADLQGFAAFLKTTGWTTIWSLNLGRDTLDDAVIEAKAVAETLGSSLQAFELGNEVENYGNGSTPLRTSPYTFETFHSEYLRWRAAILQAVPKARFAGPDSASSVEWVEHMATETHGDLQLLTTHYYRGGQKQGTFDQLLQADPRLQTELDRLRKASLASGIPWRMCEASSFYGGGRPGVSDTLVGALWTLDFMLLLAANGCAGVNIETGENQLGFVSSYSPIEDDGHGLNTAAAPYYGMLAFAAAAEVCSRIFPLRRASQDTNVTAYALGSHGAVTSVVIVNRERAGEVSVNLSAMKLGQARVSRLTGPAFDSTTGITFAGAAADAEGRWTAAAAESVHGESIVVPAMSAVVVRLQTQSRIGKV
jgi:hypothetical protein